MLGSHLDTVRDAGKYDGMLGVVAGDRVRARAARARRRLPFAVEVVGFADEEGVRFGATLLGSRAVAGTFDPTLLDSGDAHGIVDARRADGVRPRPRRASRRRRAPRERRARLRRAAHRAGAGARSRRPAGRRGHRDQRRQPLRRRDRRAWPATPAPCRWRCAGTRSPRRRNACWRSSAAARASRSSSAPWARIEAAPGATNVIPGNARVHDRRPRARATARGSRRLRTWCARSRRSARAAASA